MYPSALERLRKGDFLHRPKKTLDFWLSRYVETKIQYERNYTLVGIKKWGIEEIQRDRPLRKHTGCALNRDYWGFKVQMRRKKWLKRRLIKLTQDAGARKKLAKLEKKLAWIFSRIEALGGTSRDLEGYMEAKWAEEEVKEEEKDPYPDWY